MIRMRRIVDDTNDDDYISAAQVSNGYNNVNPHLHYMNV